MLCIYVVLVYIVFGVALNTTNIITNKGPHQELYVFKLSPIRLYSFKKRIVYDTLEIDKYIPHSIS